VDRAESVASPWLSVPRLYAYSNLSVSRLYALQQRRLFRLAPAPMISPSAAGDAGTLTTGGRGSFARPHPGSKTAGQDFVLTLDTDHSVDSQRRAAERAVAITRTSRCPRPAIGGGPIGGTGITTGSAVISPHHVIHGAKTSASGTIPLASSRNATSSDPSCRSRVAVSAAFDGAPLTPPRLRTVSAQGQARRCPSREPMRLPATGSGGGFETSLLSTSRTSTASNVPTGRPHQTIQIPRIVDGQSSFAEEPKPPPATWQGP
jgi:hypothetical protein